jgi:hypothetical protein
MATTVAGDGVGTFASLVGESPYRTPSSCSPSAPQAAASTSFTAATSRQSPPVSAFPTIPVAAAMPDKGSVPFFNSAPSVTPSLSVSGLLGSVPTMASDSSERVSVSVSVSVP